jgi:2-polyprenyl-3-methyl-5-hydroxy-6-metoxy-1,4-benzoquinol methylase
MHATSAPSLPASPPDERRFRFGRNWKAFGRHVDERRIDDARASLIRLIGLTDLTGLRVVDVGCGSGLFSLAAARLGARVHSFDYDTDSVETTRALKESFAPDRADWTIEQGSILDDAYVRRLGTFDIVYSWGVLHHTGGMHEAFAHAADLVAPGGRLAIAIYNDQGWISRYWLAVKRIYNGNAAGKGLVITAHLPYLAARWTVRTLKSRRPERGMRLWTDLLDWLGGYPFEVATPRDVIAEFERRGFTSRGLWTCGRRHGCNEFLFERTR